MIQRALSFLCILVLPASLLAKVTSVGLDRSQYTSDVMIGNVVAEVIFVESDGTWDPDSEDWSEDRKAQVLSKVLEGMDWWTEQCKQAPLSFTLLSRTVTTRYEPITRPYYDQSYWITEIMEKLGYRGTEFSATRDYVNALRETNGADWGFIIFVVDSLNDTNGKFADGFFAYAYLGGPFLVMTYDNNGYGIQYMDYVAAHEMGHIFHALDQYAGASSPQDYSHGYFPTINGNHVFSSIATDPNSIMRGGLRKGLDPWAKAQIGWRDEDVNNRLDIADQAPLITLNPQSVTLGSGLPGFTGKAALNVLPRQGNSSGYGFIVDNISKVEYHLKGTGGSQSSDTNWLTAVPADGAFDGPSEDFVISASAVGGLQALSAQSLDVHVVTRFDSYSVSAGTGSTRLAAAPTLDGAHAFPNPFKPNSALGHTQITFTGLTSGAKVQIFTTAGEPVYEKTIDASATTLSWLAQNQDGKAVATGVYYYLITDPAGGRKRGKLAIIR